MRRLIPLLLASLTVIGCNHRWDSTKVQPLGKTGTKVSLDQFRGKVLLLDFWATTCGPCQQLSPQIEGLYSKYKDKGLMVFGISAEPEYVIKGFQAKFKRNYPLYVDTDASASVMFNVTGVPTVVLIGKNGDLIVQTSGYPLPNDFEEKIQNALK